MMNAHYQTVLTHNLKEEKQKKEALNEILILL
jgi:hypothetical protein